MMKSLLFIAYVVGFLGVVPACQAAVAPISRIEDIRGSIDVDTLVLSNIAEVLLDTETSLGSQRWRKWLRERVSPAVHDSLTLFAFQQVPPICPEQDTVALIHDLQARGVVILALTSRGRNEWYSSSVANVDVITEAVLLRVGIDFTKTHLPSALTSLPEVFAPFYHAGIIYAGNSTDKGQLLRDILMTTGYRPSRIVYVDDKLDSLEEMESQMHHLDIPFVGYVYNKTAGDHANFDPLIALVQLDILLTSGRIPMNDVWDICSDAEVIP